MRLAAHREKRAARGTLRVCARLQAVVRAPSDLRRPKHVVLLLVEFLDRRELGNNVLVSVDDKSGFVSEDHLSTVKRLARVTCTNQ